MSKCPPAVDFGKERPAPGRNGAGARLAMVQKALSAARAEGVGDHRSPLLSVRSAAEQQKQVGDGKREQAVGGLPICSQALCALATRV